MTVKQADAKPRHADSRPEWAMPEWMERYRAYINNTGGNSVEDLMNDHGSTLHNNGIRAILCCACAAQVQMLEALHRAGQLRLK